MYFSFPRKKELIMEPGLLPFERGLNFNFLKGQTKVFVIHGHDEENLKNLKLLLYEFNLKPIVLKETHFLAAMTIIECLEKICLQCKYAIALCTPDDEVRKDDKIYFQPRANVLYELGWFCAKRGRRNLMIIVRQGAEIFSDFDGILRINFQENVSECYQSLHKALKEKKIGI